MEGGGSVSDTHYRRYVQADLTLRAGGDGRTIFGIAVPYGRPAKIASEGIVEQFVRGAFAKQVRTGVHTRVPFTRGHVDTGGSIIGVTRLLREDPAGLYGEWEIAKTPAGDETLELLRIGALRDLSIGFDEGTNRYTGTGVTERVTSTLKEVAMVPQGAYGEFAMAQGIRAADVVQAYTPALATPNLDEARKLLASLPPLS